MGLTKVHGDSEVTFSYLSADILFVPGERVWNPRGRGGWHMLAEEGKEG